MLGSEAAGNLLQSVLARWRLAVLITVMCDAEPGSGARSGLPGSGAEPAGPAGPGPGSGTE